MTFEYVLLDGVNDSREDAPRLVRLLEGHPGKVNLIPFNDWEGSRFARPPLPRIIAFQAYLLVHTQFRDGAVAYCLTGCYKKRDSIVSYNTGGGGDAGRTRHMRSVVDPRSRLAWRC